MQEKEQIAEVICLKTYREKKEKENDRTTLLWAREYLGVDLYRQAMYQWSMGELMRTINACGFMLCDYYVEDAYILIKNHRERVAS